MAQNKNSKQGNHQGTGHREGAGIDRKLHDPVEDRLVPLAPLDLREIHSIDDIVRAMAKTAFTGRQLGEAADVLEAMARDQDAFIVMTLAGAMTVAKARVDYRGVDRTRHRECNRLNGCVDGAWAGRGYRPRPLPP